MKKKRESGADKSESRASKCRAVSVELCLFCERGTDAGSLHQVSTFDADYSMCTMINELQDTYLLAKIDGGDIIAKEIKYHLKCLVGLRNRYRSHNRVTNEERIAISVCERFKEDGVVVPANLHKGLYTVGALDNIDHNPSSTTAVGAFHGCGISLFQFPTRTNPGESRLPIVIPPKLMTIVCQKAMLLSRLWLYHQLQ